MRAYTTKATIKKLGSYSSDKASFSTKNDIHYGYFSPIEADQNTVALGITSQAYQFVTPGYKVIKAGDILIIAGTDYGVRGVARTSYASIDILRCVLEKSVKL